MGYALLTGYEFLIALVPCVVVFLILRVSYGKRRAARMRGHFFAVLVFAIYLFGVFHFTQAGTLYDARLYGLVIKAEQVNLVPFSTGIDPVAYCLNVVMLVPLGFLLPFIWPNLNKWGHAFASGLSLSLLIELSQLLNNRRTDIDDLLMNTLGALIGFLIFRIFARITGRMGRSTPYYRCEALVYVLVMFACRFLLYF